MILSIILIVIIAGVAFFHYTQGLYASTSSAFAAGFAALLSFGIYEPIVLAYFAPKLGSYATALTMVVIFAAAYTALRLLIDNLIPGNVRYPIALDKGGAAVMGLVAGFFCSAILALVAQSLPFGISATPYAMYETDSSLISVQRMFRSDYGMSSRRDATEDTIYYYGEIQNPDVPGEDSEADRKSLMLPVDQWFLAMVGKLSGPGGALAGPTDVADIYPDYQLAMFGYQAGTERAAKQAATPEDVNVPYIFGLEFGEDTQFPDGIIRVDGELREDTGEQVDDTYTPPAGKKLVVLRCSIGKDAEDIGGLIRFSPGVARLVIDGKQYYPIGSLEAGQFLIHHRFDDYLFTEEGMDLVYEVDEGDIVTNSEPQRMGEQAFFEFKRFGRFDLSDQRIFRYVTNDPAANMMRKIPTKMFLAARLENTTLDELRGPQAYDEMRNRQPAEAPTPENAETRYVEGNAETVGASDRVEGSGNTANDEDEPEADGEGRIGDLRGEMNRRNEALEGGDGGDDEDPEEEGDGQ